MSAMQLSDSATMSLRADDLFAEYQQNIHRRTDRLFALLMVLQWIAGIIFAVWVSPLAWYGTRQPDAHPCLGGRRPGRRHLPVPRAARRLPRRRRVHALHDRGGADADGRAADPSDRRTPRNAFPRLRLAGLPRLLSRLASPHPGHDRRRARSLAARIFWPQSVYGVLVTSQWRWIEHAAWVVFEDVFLFVSCRQAVTEMKETALRTAALEQEVRTRQQAETEASLTAAQLRVTQQQAEAATRAKSDFLASMSHELRTPLNAIILYSELLQEEADDQGRRRHRSTDLQRIQSAGKHLLELINGILDLSKIEAGKMTLSLETIRRRARWSTTCVDTVGPLVAEEQQHAHGALRRRASALMLADLMKTRQILLNLLSNAGEVHARRHDRRSTSQPRTDGGPPRRSCSRSATPASA